MRPKTKPPIYSHVAFDIASKISQGLIKEGESFSGRSLMLTQYQVSQETIRRALKELSDMEIVRIHAGRGAEVLSRQRANDYMHKFQTSKSTLSLKNRLRSLISQRDELNREIEDLITELTDLKDRFTHSDPLQSFEIVVPPEASIIGKSLRSSAFRQLTDAVIVAIKRHDEILLPPDAETVFQANDILVVTGGPRTLEHVDTLFQDL